MCTPTPSATDVHLVAVDHHISLRVGLELSLPGIPSPPPLLPPNTTPHGLSREPLAAVEAAGVARPDGRAVGEGVAGGAASRGHRVAHQQRVHAAAKAVALAAHPVAQVPEEDGVLADGAPLHAFRLGGHRHDIGQRPRRKNFGCGLVRRRAWRGQPAVELPQGHFLAVAQSGGVAGLGDSRNVPA